MIKRYYFYIVSFLLFLFNSVCFGDDFQAYKEQQEQDFSSYLSQQEKDYNKYKAEIIAKWGEFLGSTKKEWVDYGSQKESRTAVDFEKGKVKIEVLVPAKAKKVEELAQKKIKEQLKQTMSHKWPEKMDPLKDQIKIEKETLEKDNVDDFVDNVLTEKIKIEKEPVKVENEEPKVKVTVSFDMVPNHMKIRAERYKPLVLKHCEKRKIDPAIVFGIIHTESAFNPMARSYVPAFGLMQLVPKSGGRDAFRYVFGRDERPTPEFLYDPENNINLGIAYIDLTKNKYFKGIDNETTAYLLTIASYNTGPGNVAKAFTGRTVLNPAVDKANSMNSQKVHKTLIHNLPYKETQDYVQKVLSRSKLYR